MTLREVAASGLGSLELTTTLLRRARLADPTAGVWEAADLQWWWRRPRPSDLIEQLFWIDDEGPVAAALLTDWERTWGCDPIVLPGATDAVGTLVWSEILGRIDALALANVEILVRDDDSAVLSRLSGAGFEPTGERGGSTWLAARGRPAVPPVPPGFRLRDRIQRADRPHHLIPRNTVDVETRLHDCSMYDPELDLAIEAPDGEVVAYGLFWFDPVTQVGLVEPMRTEAGYQRLGLARTVLATGLDRLADRGATRLKVSFVSDAARNLYLGAGFRVLTTDQVYARRTG